MGKSYRNEKSFGGPKKRKAGGNYNQRREERQRLRKGKAKEVDDIVEKYREDPNSYTDYENYQRFKEENDGRNKG